MSSHVLRGARATAAYSALNCVGCLLLLAACSEGASAPDTKAASEGSAAPATNSGSAGAMGVASNGAATSGLLISLADGQIQGDMVGSARRFLNIPYAKPALGELRWEAAVPSAPWSGVRHESEFIKGCAQLADQGAPASDNEDCLYLNVWSPEPAPERAPVTFCRRMRSSRRDTPHMLPSPHPLHSTERPHGPTQQTHWRDRC